MSTGRKIVIGVLVVAIIGVISLALSFSLDRQRTKTVKPAPTKTTEKNTTKTNMPEAKGTTDSTVDSILKSVDEEQAITDKELQDSSLSEDTQGVNDLIQSNEEAGL